jgi:hypothetical protein
MVDHLSDMTALLTMLSLGIAYVWLCVVVNRRQRAQQLVLELRRRSSGPTKERASSNS